MNKITIALTGAGLGAAAMYLMDPSRGRRVERVWARQDRTSLIARMQSPG